MLAHPQSVPSQAVSLAALDQAVGAYPVCEAWVSAARQAVSAIPLLDAKGLRRLGEVARGAAKALGWVQGQIPQEVPAVLYVSGLALSAHRVGTMARLASLSPGGTAALQLSSAAVSALITLQAWDDAQGYYQPLNPAATGLQLLQGVTFPT